MRSVVSNHTIGDWADDLRSAITQPKLRALSFDEKKIA